jgi:hypothetical protein
MQKFSLENRTPAWLRMVRWSKIAAHRNPPIPNQTTKQNALIGRTWTDKGVRLKKREMVLRFYGFGV